MFTFSSWKLYNLRKQIQTKKLKSIVQTNLFDELNYGVFSIFTIQEGDKACITVFSLLIRENYKYRSSTKLFSPVRYLFYVQCFCKRGGNINQLTENERTNSWAVRIDFDISIYGYVYDKIFGIWNFGIQALIRSSRVWRVAQSTHLAIIFQSQSLASIYSFTMTPS